MKTRLFASRDAVMAAAAHVLTIIKEKEDAVLACSAGEDELLVLRALAALAEEERVSLGSLRLFAACEFDAVAPESESSMKNRLLGALRESDFRAQQLSVPSADGCEAYGETIAAAGGLDLALLGLGNNCRVAFNEPATPYASRCRVQKLTDKSRTELAPLFGGAERVPERGVTLGFQELCAAREIVVIALGDEKAEAVFQTLYARDDSVWPGAFLQLPPNVTLYIDESAGAKL